MKKFLLLYLFSFLSAISINAQTKFTPLTKQPVKTVIDFLEWYSQSDLQNILLVKAGDGEASSKEADSLNPYRVDFKSTERYLNTLTGSGFVSRKYTNAQLASFKKKDSVFIANKSFEGPPEGFDADLIMLSQDYDLSSLKKSKAILKMISPNKARVTILFAYNDLKLSYALSKNSGKWMIDEIVDSRE